jgi:hypothetical protein
LDRYSPLKTRMVKNYVYSALYSDCGAGRIRAPAQPKVPLRVKTNFISPFNPITPVQISREKYSALRRPQITSTLPRIPPHEGTFRDRHERGGGERWPRRLAGVFDADERADRPSRGLRRDRYQARRGSSRARLSRTAKPCGPGVPTLALSPGARNARFGDDGGKRARSPGRARSKPSNHRAGKAGCSRLSLWFLPRAFLFARGPRVSVDTRPSLRPLAIQRVMLLQSSGDSGRENAGARLAPGRRRIPLFDN